MHAYLSLLGSTELFVLISCFSFNHLHHILALAGSVVIEDSKTNSSPMTPLRRAELEENSYHKVERVLEERLMEQLDQAIATQDVSNAGVTTDATCEGGDNKNKEGGHEGEPAPLELSNHQPAQPEPVKNEEPPASPKLHAVVEDPLEVPKGVGQGSSEVHTAAMPDSEIEMKEEVQDPAPTSATKTDEEVDTSEATPSAAKEASADHGHRLLQLEGDLEKELDKEVEKCEQQKVSKPDNDNLDVETVGDLKPPPLVEVGDGDSSADLDAQPPVTLRRTQWEKKPKPQRGRG